MVDKLTELENADRAVETAKTREQFAAAWVQRGSLKAKYGFADAGLSDLLRAHAQWLQTAAAPALAQKDLAGLLAQFRASKGSHATVSCPSWLNAQLGEGFRVYARDVLLSHTGRLAELKEAADASIACFTSAMNDAGVPRHPWMRGHRGAVHTMLFWMQLSEDKKGEEVHFSSAEEDFHVAIEEVSADKEKKEYVWAKRFLAFLYALRGASELPAPAHTNYFNKARHLLAGDKLDRYDQSSLSRSKAMLWSYDTFAVGVGQAEREQAARHSMEESLRAVDQDPEDFMASYFGTASRWWLASKAADETVRQHHEACLPEALESAWVRSLNSISQATATLAGLAVIRATLPGQHDQQDLWAERTKQLLELFELVPPDLETRAMLSLDPVSRNLEAIAPAVKAKMQPHYDRLIDQCKVQPSPKVVRRRIR